MAGVLSWITELNLFCVNNWVENVNWSPYGIVVSKSFNSYRWITGYHDWVMRKLLFEWQWKSNLLVAKTQKRKWTNTVFCNMIWHFSFPLVTFANFANFSDYNFWKTLNWKNPLLFCWSFSYKIICLNTTSINFHQSAMSVKFELSRIESSQDIKVLKDVAKEKWDQYQYLGNCPPTPPLTQH